MVYCNIPLRIFITFLTLSLSTNLFAQEKWFEFSAGPALSFVSKKNTTTEYKGRLLPQAGVSGYISLNPRLSLKSGLLYQQKGFFSNGEIVNRDTMEINYNVQTKTTLHYVNIPLQLSYNLNDNPDGQWRIAAGMSYGFLVAAKKSATVLKYVGDQLIQQKDVTWHPLISTGAKDNEPGLPGQEGTTLYLMTPSLRADVTYQWQERLLISAFYEYSLQDIRVSRVGKENTNIHYVGISLGVKCW